MNEYEFSECSRCGVTETKEQGVIKCSVCEAGSHLTCLKNEGCGFLGDAFYTFTCSSCSETNQDVLEREKIQWRSTVILVLYNLHHQNIRHSRKGYFHWKSHISKLVDDKWKFLMPFGAKKSKSWFGIISSQLANNPHIIQNGINDLGEQGWWRLINPTFSPLYTASQKRKLPAATSKSGKDAKDAVQMPDTNTRKPESFSSTSTSHLLMEPSSLLPKVLLEEDDIDVDLDIDPPSSPEPIKDPPQMDLMALLGSKDSRKESEIQANSVVQEELSDSEDSSDESEEDDLIIRQKPKVQSQETQSKPCRPMTQYEEVQLMHKLQRAGPLPTSAARRLLRKLAVRNLQRKNGMPLFNLAYSQTGFTNNDPCFINDSQYNRVLDRFKVSKVKTENFEHCQSSFMLRLMGKIEPTCFTSPYTERLLKPYIMRENCSDYLWVKLMRELMTKANKKFPLWKPPSDETLDYSYVRPQHIPAINSLCQENFWPGIDLSETLQYPDFSCVALYKKLIVGFAFLVPDTGFNESYISFLFVRPEWRRGGIATFMLYHLIQTCMGKDVTLHVSATNPALILYQKFGFKVEEFVQDFYEKYLPVDSTECRHSVFLRLSR